MAKLARDENWASESKECPPLQLLKDYLRGELDEVLQKAAETHLKQCPACCEQVETLRKSASESDDGQTDRPAKDGNAQTATLMSPTSPTTHADRVTQTDSQAESSGGRLPLLAVGTMLGKYRLTGILGEGAMGVVYSAHDEVIGREVAIKSLAGQLKGDETALRRFLQEARAAGQIHHPNVVSVFDLIEHEGTWYLVLEKMGGGAVRDLIEPEQGMSWQMATRIIADACRGLIAAHHRGLIHRDIKPDNIMVAPDGTAKVSDFGLVRSENRQVGSLTARDQILGTPYYMSPEQCRSSRVDARSDIYSLGATYYNLLTGLPPYDTSVGAMQIMYAHCHEPVPRLAPRIPNLPPECQAIIDRAMAKEPDERYQTAEEMLVDLEALVGEATTQSGVKAPSSTVLKRPSFPEAGAVGSGAGAGGMNRRMWLASAAGLGGLGAASFYFGLWGDRDPGEQAERDDGPAVPGISSTKIRFGMTGAFSASNRELGESMSVGIRTCFDAINEEGGVHGRTLELVALDDGYEPERALANMQELVEERKVFGIVGNVGTPTARVTLPYALEKRVLFFGPFTGAEFLRNDPPDRYVFNYRASYADETAEMVRYFIERKKIQPEEIAVFAQDDSYGDAGFRGVARILRTYGIDDREIPRFDYQRNTVNVDDAVTDLLEQKDRIRAVVMVPTYKAAARFIEKARDGGSQVIFGAVSFVSGEALAEEFRERGIQYGEGVIISQVVPHYESSSTGVLKYRELLKKFHPTARPGFVSLEGYVTACCLVEGLRIAGRRLNTESLVDALESIRGFDLGIGPIIEFGPSRHQGSQKVWGTILDSSGQLMNLNWD